MAPHVTNVPIGTPQPQDMALVTLTVSSFNDVCTSAPSKTNRLTQATMTLVPDKARKVRLQNNTLIVTAPGATIQFMIASIRREKIYPVGIAFLREKPTATNVGERLGLQNFDRPQSPDARFLLIDDHFARSAQREIKRYKFSTIIQRGSDGKLGIIDPGIVNES